MTMKTRDHKLLLRASLDELSPDEAGRLQDLLDRDPEARSELERMRRLQDLVAGAPRGSFAPLFASRVLQGLRAERAVERTSLADSLAWLFYRAAPAALLLVAALLAFNVVSRGEDSQSPIEAALGLPAVTLDAAYAFDATFYTRDVDEPTAGRRN
jgi:anti-sigma factor RsiW